MRAAVLHGPWDVRIADLRDPEPAANEVLIRVAGCGICHSDLHQIKGEIPSRFPKVPGHEISGTIVALGEGTDEALLGIDVVVPFIMPCGSCHECERGRDDFCELFWTLNRGRGVLYDGTTRLFDDQGKEVWMDAMSGMAEYAVVPATSVFPAPSALPLANTATIGCALFTAYGAVKNGADLVCGETVAVIAVGGVGSNVVQIACDRGASAVIAIDIGAEKLDAARVLGATATIDASEEDVVARVLEFTGGRGVDVAFEAIGRPETVQQAIGMVARGGRVVLIGVTPAGATLPLDINYLVRNQIRIIGSYGARARADMPELLTAVQEGRLRPDASVSRRVPLEDAQATFAALDRREIVGRAIVDFTSFPIRAEQASGS